ncbi:MAG: tRNA (adenosine(37)-N6)-threonylcarbamoyltransferase complex dimerization subunit type 1 TsaB [Pseudomonadota bacterium]
MRVLAIDTALGACAVAVLDNGSGDNLISESLPMARGHAEALVPLIARVMRQSDMTFADIDRVAVTSGPGSFTGLRVGISAARGISLAAGKPAVGVSTLSAYAAPHLAEDDAARVVAAIDARHEYVYLQVCEPNGGILVAPRLAPLSEAVRAASEAPSRIVGSAAQSVADKLSRGAPIPLRIDARDAPDIAWVARLGAALPAGQSPPKPQYLRAPDAQPQNAASLPRRC